MKISKEDLKHGDVILYDSHKTFIEKCIRLVIGSRFTHVGIVQDYHGELVVLEQVTRRKWTPVSTYADPGTLHVFRPRFKVQPTDYSLFVNAPYAQALCVDHLINHGIGRIIPGWRHRKMISRLIQRSRFDCGYLVSTCLGYWPNLTPEPDDFCSMSMQYMGVLGQTQP